MAANSILGIFGKSPLKPLEKHIKIATKCSKQLTSFFEACFAEDWQQAEQIRLDIKKLEDEADKIKRQIRMELPGSLFMPVDRSDLLELLTQQDKIANKTKDIAGRVIGRQLQIPASLQTNFLAYVKRCIEAAKQAAKAVYELDDLLESGFRGREVDIIEEMISKLDAIEADTDKMQIALRRELLAIEAGLNPVDVMFLYQIIEWVGDLADLAERAGSRLEIMLAK